jgi:hypothetical protein
MNLLRREFRRAPNVVDIIGITAIDKDVAGFQQVCQIGDGFIHDCCGNHQPDRSRLRELADEVSQRDGSYRFLKNQLLYRLW